MQYVYQEMLKKKQERDRLAQVGKVRYEYDSDEETEGGGDGVRILKVVLEVKEVEVLTSVFNFNTEEVYHPKPQN